MATARQVALACARACEEKKAVEILVMNVSKQTFMTEYFVICTARHPRQARAIADSARRAAEDLGQRELGREGVREGAWVLTDYGDVVLHIFSEEMREFYELESIWADARKLDWKRAAKPKRRSTTSRA